MKLKSPDGQVGGSPNPTHPTQSPTGHRHASEARPNTRENNPTTHADPHCPVLSSPPSRLPRAAWTHVPVATARGGRSLARGVRACHLPPRPRPCSLLPIAIAFAGAPLSLIELPFPCSVSRTLTPSCSRIFLSLLGHPPSPLPPPPHWKGAPAVCGGLRLG